MSPVSRSTAACTQNESPRILLKLNDIDPGRYREAMSRLAGHVHIVTTKGEAGRKGVTATAVASVSDNPGTIIVCLNRTVEGNDLFERNGNMCINTLAGSHIDLARVFAGEGGLGQDERFARGDWTTLGTGAPVLSDALTAFDCVVTDSRPVATHFVIMGEVRAIGQNRDATPLLYHARQYKVLD